MFLMRLLVLLLSLLGLVSCSQQGSSKAVVTVVQADLSSIANPAIFFGKNLTNGKRTVKKLEPGSNTIELSLPNGDWRFSIMAWDGTNVFEGIARCYSDTFKLCGGKVTVNAELSRYGCANPVFGGSDSHDATNGLRSVVYHACSTVSEVTDQSSNCNGAFRSLNRSFKFSMLQMDEESGPGKSVALETGCFNSAELSASISTGLRLPLGDVGESIELVVKGYPDADCLGSPTIQAFPNGLKAPNSKAFSSTSTTWFAISPGLYNAVQLYSESGSICDFGAQVVPTKVGDSTYVFRRITSGTDSYLMKSTGLGLNSGLPILTDSGQSIGTVDSGLLVGTNYYFVAAKENAFTFRLYSFSGNSAYDLVGTNLIQNGDASNRTGADKGLAVYESKVYFGFRPSIGASRMFCSVSLVDNLFDCSDDDTQFLNATVVASNSSGVYYTANDTMNSSKFSLIHFDGTDHNVKEDLNTLNGSTVMSSWQKPELLSVGAFEYLYLPTNTGAALINILGSLTTVMSTKVDVYPVILPDEILTSELGLPIIVQNASISNVATLANYNFGVSQESKPIGRIGNYFYFTVRSSSNTHIYAFDSFLDQVTKITSVDGFSDYSFAILNNKVYFIPLYDPTPRTQLYQIDGVALTLVSNVSSSVNSWSPIITSKGKMYFTADNGTSGSEPWVSDGTPAGTQLLKDITPGSSGSFSQFLGEYGDYVLFKTYDRLYRTQGTTETTSILYGHPSGSGFGVINRLEGGILVPFQYTSPAITRGMVFFKPLTP